MSAKLFVGNLSYSTDESKLEALFSEVGSVVSTKIVRDQQTGSSKGFGFVEMNSEDEANEAISTLNGKDVDGRTLKVDKAKPPQNRSGGGRGFGGGGGGGGRGFGGGGGGRRGGNRY